MSFLRTISLILLTMTAMHTTMSQFTDVVNGYARYTRGEHLGYRSFHPYASASLLTRCLDGKSTIAWETDPVPQDLTGENVTFVWMAAHSSGTSGGDATFRLSVDGRDALQFTTVKERRVRQWGARQMIARPVVSDRCVGCGVCIAHCPAQTIAKVEGKARKNPRRRRI